MILELNPFHLFNTIQCNVKREYRENIDDHSKELQSITSPIRVLLAYSGGLDSHVLLHLLSQIPQNQVRTRAIYINHGLQTQSDSWAIHCTDICSTLTIPFDCIDLSLDVPKGKSTEDYARKARYEALKSSLSTNEILLTAHHQNDQAETLLLQLFRGAGVQGLAAMPEINRIGQHKSNQFHMRPLLAISRQNLDDYAEKHKLNHIEDPSNQDTNIDRNFLRQSIMPQLRERWLGIDKTIARSASIQAETKNLLDELAADLLPTVLTNKTSAYTPLMQATGVSQPLLNTIDLERLKRLSKSKQRLLLRYWISQQGFSHPSEKKMAHILSDLINVADDKQPLIEWSGVELRRYQHQLHIMSPLSHHNPAQTLSWDLEKSLEISTLGISLNHTNLSESVTKHGTTVNVKFRRGGEAINIIKRGNVSLKNLFQERGVPPWMRSRIPLIYIGDTLVQLIGIDDIKVHPPTF